MFDKLTIFVQFNPSLDVGGFPSAINMSEIYNHGLRGVKISFSGCFVLKKNSGKLNLFNYYIYLKLWVSVRVLRYIIFDFAGKV